MNHNAMGGRYWGRLYDEFPDFQLALLDDGELIAEVHALPVHVDAELPQGWDEAFERGMELGDGNVLSLLAISVRPDRRGGAVSRRADRRGARTRPRAAGLASVIAPVRPTLKERYPLIPIERYVEWRRDDGSHFDPWIRVHERVGGEIVQVGAELDADRGAGRGLGGVDGDELPGGRHLRRARDARAARGARRHRHARRAERLDAPLGLKTAVHRPVTTVRRSVGRNHVVRRARVVS